MCLFGIGFKGLTHFKFIIHRRITVFIVDETMIQLEIQIVGCGFVLNQFIDLPILLF